MCFHDVEIQIQPSQQRQQLRRGVATIVYIPKGMFRTGSLWLRSNLRIHIGKGASIYGSDDPADYPVVPMVPNGYYTGMKTMYRALFAGYNIENVSITGENYGYPAGSLARFSWRGDSDRNKNNNKNWKNDTNLSVIDGVGWKWWCKSRYVRPTYLDLCRYLCVLGLETNSIRGMECFLNWSGFAIQLQRFIPLTHHITHTLQILHSSTSFY